MPDTHYSEAYIRDILRVQPWINHTRRAFATLREGYTAWTPPETIDGPALVTWIQNEDKSINTVVTKL
jgi:hypothetical protein